MSEPLLTAVALARTSLWSLISSFTGSNASGSVLPFLPRPIRLLFVLLLMLNIKSFPFAWHLRLFRPLFLARLKWAWLRLTFASPYRKAAFVSSLSSIGKSPFALRTTYATWVSPDDTDYNIHLSNSCYSKLIDMVRMEFAVSHLIPTFRDGCWIALGATHARYIKEIPTGRRYEVRMYTGAWDGKWVYVVSRFVSKNPKSKKTIAVRDALEGRDTPNSTETVPFPDMHTPASGDISLAPSGTSTPNPALIRPVASDASSTSAHVHAKLLEDVHCVWPEAEDETLHCVVVNEMCFKHGRITVPPSLALALAGCGMEEGGEAWGRLQALRAGKGKGKKKSKKGSTDLVGDANADGHSPTLKDLLRGAWKDVPSAERWWEHALAPFEAENTHRLDVLQGLREGLASVSAL